MARKRRNCPPGIVFHLCNRTAGALPLFQTPYDYRQVIQVFREALTKFPIDIFAYCLMPNHWHLLVRCRRPKAVSRFMHWFGTTHAARYRKSHDTVGCGAVYQNRFRSHPVEGARAFLKTAAYIERNPLEAGLVQEASIWPWSSARESQDLPVKAWPVPKPSNWPRLLGLPLEAGIIRRIHYAEISAEGFRVEPPRKHPLPAESG